MKIPKIVLLAPIVTVFLFITLIILLIEIHPYKPGDFFFRLQKIVEISSVNISFSPEKRAEGYFNLVERRLDDLEGLSEVERVPATVEAFDQTLTRAIECVENLDWHTAVVYYHNVHPLMHRVESILDQLPSYLSQKDLVLFREKVVHLKTCTGSSEVIKYASVPYSEYQIEQKEKNVVIVKETSSMEVLDEVSVDKEPVSDCMDCHSYGLYKDPDSRCSDCHLREVYFTKRLGTDAYRPVEYMEKYPDHFFGDCRYCHLTKSWEIEEFHHPFTFSCLVCHEQDNPELKQELPNQVALMGGNQMKSTSLDPHNNSIDCVLCHKNTENWHDYSFKHTETCSWCHFEDKFIPINLQEIECTKTLQCAECHEPVGHRADFGDQCADCHASVTTWLPATFDHTGYTNCITCHVQDKPASHISTTNCVACHSTTDWGTLLFDHSSAADCKSCHIAPSDHADKGYTEQCSTCHSTFIWDKPLFHLVLGNCNSCHNSPTNHYPALCSSCHDTDSWLNISINHTTLTRCTDCHTVPTTHYPGACTSCHNTSSWHQITVDHSTLTTCTNCHQAPVPHFPAACTSCHNTTSWSQINVNHSGLTNCTDCHSAPPNHYIGSCLTCHTTSSWSTLIYHDNLSSDCSTCHSAPGGHYPGECMLCHHSTTSWVADFDHLTITLSCSSCHVSPTDHWEGECSNCHVTSSWSEVEFDHSGYTDCKSCHTSPKGHPNAQCSNCHTTVSWEIQD